MSHIRVLAGLVLVAALTARLAGQDSHGVHVCIGADRVLRYVAATQCPAGQTSHQLVEAADDLSAEPEKPEKEGAQQISELQKQEKASAQRIAELQKTIETLSARLASLERAPGRKDTSNVPASSRVYAPFEVLDKMGNPILRISDEAAAVGLKSASRVLLTRGTADNYVLQFRTALGVYSSSVGESATGYGVLHLHDQGGNVRVRADSKDGLLLFNPAAAVVGRLSFGPKGGGYLQLAEPGGTPMVEAGAFVDGVGRVIAGPNFKCQGNPAALSLGLPDCIKGHK